MTENILSLYDLNRMVREAIEGELPDKYWVTAELSEVRLSTRGHCFIELIDKSKETEKVRAKARAVIMSHIFPLLSQHFEEVTNQTFQAGIKVLLLVSVSFDEQYGYSLIVNDINPTYTLGDIARRRIEILERLTKEGVINLNKELELCMPCNRVAIISSPTAAGYGDFCNQLDNNQYGLRFIYKLFPATMQGEEVEASILSTFDDIFNEIEEWDVVVIIRGGGAVSDLNGFETYNLANACAQFPLPIFTGIGHERDTTMLDFVSNKSFKTPTAVATWLIDNERQLALNLKESEERLIANVQYLIEKENNFMKDMLHKVELTTRMFLAKCRENISIKDKQLPIAIKKILSDNRYKISMQEKAINISGIDRILNMGFSITRVNGKAIKDVSQVKEKDVITTQFANGYIESIVK